MEARTTETSAALTDPRSAISPVSKCTDGTDEQLARIAETAAHALDVPLACVYIDEVGQDIRTGYGLRDDGLDAFLATLDLDPTSGRPVIIVPKDTASSGDGAAIRSFIAVPLIGRADGFLCVADYTDRQFCPDDVRLVEHFATLVAGDLRRQHEIKSLRRSENLFRAVTEDALDTVAIVDRHGIFRYLSDSADGILGFGSTAGIGRSIYEDVLDEDLGLLTGAFEGAAGEGDMVDVEYRIIHPDGVLRRLRLRGRNLIGRKGIGGFLVHVRDATDRAQFEEELRKSRDRAEEMNRLKSVFLTNMSHEIRTPLTTILGFAEILEDEVGEEEREFVRLIQQGGQRLLDTLMSILDLARLESSSFEIEPEEFDVAQRIWDTCLLLEPLAQEKGLYLRVEGPQEPLPAFLDISAVERVVSNLVSNGIKFTPEGGVTITIEADDEDVLLHVADTGIGISDEFMPFLFEEFKQESEGLSRVHEGSGLGLPITKRLVELMKGNIMAESEKGTGSVFTVALPRNGEQAANGQTAPADSASKARVLVVEDNADTRTLVNHLLRKSYDVTCASDGEEALGFAAENNFDALLVDINLGKGKSGEDVLHEIKSLPGYEETPVIAVTAYAMPGDRERFFSEGFDDYVSKPFSKQRLLEALEGVLE